MPQTYATNTNPVMVNQQYPQATYAQPATIIQQPQGYPQQTAQVAYGQPAYYDGQQHYVQRQRPVGVWVSLVPSQFFSLL